MLSFGIIIELPFLLLENQIPITEVFRLDLEDRKIHLTPNEEKEHKLLEHLWTKNSYKVSPEVRIKLE